jgi:DNA adenine methylase
MTKETRIQARPVLHYLGSKWAIAPWVISHFPEHTTYVEPFGGGAAVLLRKAPSPVEVYNDLDHAVVSFWRVLRERPEALVEQLRRTPWAREEYLLAWQPCAEELEAARRFFVRCWMSYTGASDRPSGWRVNARTRSGSIPHWGREERLLEVAQRWRQVQIEHDDALAVMRRFDGPETLHYCDPPYVPASRTSGAGYQCELTEDRHRELLETLLDLRGQVVLSGYPNELYERTLERRGWSRVERQARTRDAKAPRTECLWIRPKI